MSDGVDAGREPAAETDSSRNLAKDPWPLFGIIADVSAVVVLLTSPFKLIVVVLATLAGALGIKSLISNWGKPLNRRTLLSMTVVMVSLMTISVIVTLAATSGRGDSPGTSNPSPNLLPPASDEHGCRYLAQTLEKSPGDREAGTADIKIASVELTEHYTKISVAVSALRGTLNLPANQSQLSTETGKTFYPMLSDWPAIIPSEQSRSGIIAFIGQIPLDAEPLTLTLIDGTNTNISYSAQMRISYDSKRCDLH
ncbi:hypothetical protein [Amycolatopsis sp. cmx-4-61]|uniref:hypothetical protein n=1 Tax=Amycolatopsis sp. cmx-4-61 TaxID=2790937 RepID=UPI00397BF66C